MSSSITLKSRHCVETFHGLSKVLNDTPAPYSISQSVCLDELGRFRLWASNIGAQLDAGDKMSLDYRLRNAPKLVSRIMEFLDDLSEALDDGVVLRWSSTCNIS